MVAGKEVTPADVRDTERLRSYWTHGAGAVKIRWGEPNDWYRCVAELGKYVSDPKGLCENYHVAATGMTTAEHSKMIKAAEGKTAAKKLGH